ncbi:complement resistance protein TraT, partial [Vibrio breoganii]
LEPVAPHNRVVFVSIRDVTGNSMRRGMMDKIRANLNEEGFTITNDPQEANFMLSATIIQAGNTTKEEATGYLNSGFEGALAGGVTAAALGADSRTIGGVALVGAAAGFLADTLIDDSYFTFVMDVQMRERPMDGDDISNQTKNASLSAQASANRVTASKNTSNVTRGSNYNWIVYETRIVTTANQMNLKIDDALPAVQKRTASSLTELLL